MATVSEIQAEAEFEELAEKKPWPQVVAKLVRRQPQRAIPPGTGRDRSLQAWEGVGLLQRSPRYALRSPPAPDLKGLGQNGSIWPEYALIGFVKQNFDLA